MDETGKKLLNLMFRPEETVCVSHNKYGYHSIPLSEVLGKEVVTLVPTEESCAKRKIEWKPENFEKAFTGNLTLVALNPIKGWREDSNCTAFRNFLIEMDAGDLKGQYEYIQYMGIPYSAVIFSGNKSLHFLISLEQDLPDEKEYRFFSEWILNALPMADDKTKNPSRGIRIPGAFREPQKKQRLVELKGPVNNTKLLLWLAKHMDAKPKKPEKRVPGSRNFDAMPMWVTERLIKGIDPAKGRNQQWYAIAYEFALTGYTESETLEFLGDYFTPERDFKEREWRTAIKSAFKHVYEK